MPLRPAAFITLSTSEGTFARRTQYIHELKHILGRRTHGNLPRVYFSPLSAHCNNRKKWNSADSNKRKHVHAVADAARFASARRNAHRRSRRPRKCDTFLFGGKCYGADLSALMDFGDQMRIGRRRGHSSPGARRSFPGPRIFHQTILACVLYPALPLMRVPCVGDAKLIVAPSTNKAP